MIIYAAPLITLQLLFPLFALILMASYFKEFVIVCIAIITIVNAAVLKSKCLKKKLYCDICKLQRDTFKKRSKKEPESIFYTSIFTSWISPCTVWANNFKFKSYFLIVNSLTVLLGHSLGIVSISILTYFEVLKLDLLQNENPPITHCFKNQDNVSLRYIHYLCFLLIYLFYHIKCSKKL